MRLLSPSQEAALLRRVRKAHAKLVDGILKGDLPEVSFAHGVTSSAVPEGEAHTIWQLRSMIKARSVELDSDAVEAARDRLTDAAKAVRDRLVSKVRTALRDGSALLRRRKLSRRDLAKARRAAIAIAREQVEKALEAAEREWSVAVGVSIHDAMEDGRASTIAKSGGGRALVYKAVQPDCCRYCRLLYTVDGVRPRVFHLDDLVANGSNVGRRAGRPTMKGAGATEWLPVIGSLHPNCKCVLKALPAGYGFTSTGRLAKVSKKQ